jgi:putative transposase
MPNTYVQLLCHIVFATKDRYPYLTSAVRERVYRYIGGIVREQGGLVVEIGGIEDHVYILATLRPHPSLAEVVQRIKGGSSHWINEEGLVGMPFAWQKGYAAFSVSASQMPAVVRYIQRQEEHHRKLGYEGEIERLQARHALALGLEERPPSGGRSE